MELATDLHGFFWGDPRVNNCNTYLVTGAVPVLIDPGHAAFLRGIEEEMALLGLSVGDIGVVLVTHGHPDHMEGASAFTRLPARIAIHEKEAAFIGPLQEAFYRSQGVSPPDIAFDFFLREGDLKIGDHSFEILHTPGHSPGSISIYWPNKKALFTGDVLFQGGLGRTDLPGGDSEQLKASLLRLGALDVDWLLPGHGAPVKGKEAVRKNLDLVQRTYFDYV